MVERLARVVFRPEDDDGVRASVPLEVFGLDLVAPRFLDQHRLPPDLEEPLGHEHPGLLTRQHPGAGAVANRDAAVEVREFEDAVAVQRGHEALTHGLGLSVVEDHVALVGGHAGRAVVAQLARADLHLARLAAGRGGPGRCEDPALAGNHVAGAVVLEPVGANQALPLPEPRVALQDKAGAAVRGGRGGGCEPHRGGFFPRRACPFERPGDLATRHHVAALGALQPVAPGAGAGRPERHALPCRGAQDERPRGEGELQFAPFRPLVAGFDADGLGRYDRGGLPVVEDEPHPVGGETAGIRVLREVAGAGEALALQPLPRRPRPFADEAPGGEVAPPRGAVGPLDRDPAGLGRRFGGQAVASGGEALDDGRSGGRLNVAAVVEYPVEADRAAERRRAELPFGPGELELGARRARPHPAPQNGEAVVERDRRHFAIVEEAWRKQDPRGLAGGARAAPADRGAAGELDGVLLEGTARAARQTPQARAGERRGALALEHALLAAELEAGGPESDAALQRDLGTPGGLGLVAGGIELESVGDQAVHHPPLVVEGDLHVAELVHAGRELDRLARRDPEVRLDAQRVGVDETLVDSDRLAQPFLRWRLGFDRLRLRRLPEAALEKAHDQQRRPEDEKDDGSAAQDEEPGLHRSTNCPMARNFAKRRRGSSSRLTRRSSTSALRTAPPTVLIARLGSMWAPPSGSGMIASITPSSRRFWAVRRRALAARCTWVWSFHRIAAHPSGEMTE